MPPFTRTKLKTEDRQAELVQAALLLAAQRSPSEITTADLARGVGISQGAVFKHFASKEALWLAVIDWTRDTLIEALRQAALAHQGQPWQALRAVFMAHVDFVTRYPGVPRLIFQELQHASHSALKDRVQDLLSEYRQLLSDLLSQARKSGHLAPAADARAAALLFIGAVQGLVMQSLITGRLQDMKPQARAVFDIYEAGLRIDAPTEERKHP